MDTEDASLRRVERVKPSLPPLQTELQPESPTWSDRMLSGATSPSRPQPILKSPSRASFLSNGPSTTGFGRSPSSTRSIRGAPQTVLSKSAPANNGWNGLHSPSHTESPTRAAEPRKLASSWQAPPLFQAYPQANKHSPLWCPSVPAEDILRLYKPDTNMKTGILDEEGRDSPISPKRSKTPRKHHSKKDHKLSGLVSKMGWAKKVFVLVTSGYLLQYAAEGSFDRRPEKILKVGPESVAFATDVIAGKPWVLQVSQSWRKGCAVLKNRPKSGFPQLSFRRSWERKQAANFLLIMENPDEMNSWIRAIRGQIENTSTQNECGGIVVRADSSDEPRNDMSFRSDPYRLPASGRPSNPSPLRPGLTRGRTVHDVESSSISRTSEYSDPVRPTVDVARGKTLPTQIAAYLEMEERNHWEALRDAPRLSFASSKSSSFSASRGSSAGYSPKQLQFDVLPGIPSTSPSTVSEVDCWAAEGLKQFTKQSYLQPCKLPPTHQDLVKRPCSRQQSPSVRNFSVPTSNTRFCGMMQGSNIYGPRAHSRLSTFEEHNSDQENPQNDETDIIQSQGNPIVISRTTPEIDVTPAANTPHQNISGPPSDSSRRSSMIEDRPLPPLPPPSPPMGPQISNRTFNHRPASMMPQMSSPSATTETFEDSQRSKFPPRSSSFFATSPFESVPTPASSQNLRLANRKSMPTILTSFSSLPPPAHPPPNCPLPLLPSARAPHEA